MMDYAKSNGALEEFKDVLEYHFSNLFYRNTLFAYMQSEGKKEWKFLKKMGEEMLETFPDFRQNPYYNQTVNEYEQNLINIHLKSTCMFLVVYKLKMLSKRIRGNKRK